MIDAQTGAESATTLKKTIIQGASIGLAAVNGLEERTVLYYIRDSEGIKEAALYAA